MSGALRVLAVTNGWPTERFPEYCVFTRRQVEDIRALGVSVDVEFVNAREKGKGEYLSRLTRLRRQAADYDVVHCFHGLSFLLARAAQVRGPMVVSFLNAIENEYIDVPAPVRPLVVGLTQRLARRRDLGVILKDRIPPALADRPLARYIPNGIDLETFRPGDRAAARAALGIDPAALCLLFVSSKDLHRPQKRHDRFEAVVAACRAAHPDRQVVALTLVSETADVVLTTYRAADVHVMTSVFEGSPNSVKEAMACALPVVSTDVGNVATMLTGQAAGAVVPDFSTDAFVAAIDRVLAAPAEARAALRESLATQGLDARSAAQRVIDLYADVRAAV